MLRWITLGCLACSTAPSEGTKETGTSATTTPTTQTTTTTPTTTGTGDTASTSTTGTSTSSTTGTTKPFTGKTRIDLEGPIVCEDPSRRSVSRFERDSYPSPEQALLRAHGGGVVAGDFAGDGAPDLFFLGSNRSDYVIQHPDGTWEQNPAGMIDPTTPMSMIFGGSVADYDGDGDLDVFLSRYKEPNLLLENDGLGNFRDVAVARGVVGSPDHFSGSSAWSDFDNDGDLDLFVSGHGYVIEGAAPRSELEPGNRSYLYTNDGIGNFTDVSAILPEAFQDTYTFIGTWVDLDRDGWTDLYGVNDLGNAYLPCNFMWSEQGTGFLMDDNLSGLDVDVAGMGLALGDLNQDGIDDFLVTAWERMKFMLSSPALGMWIDYSVDRGFVPNVDDDQVVGWGAEFGDMDNDQDLDAAIVFGKLTTAFISNPQNQPDGLWIQQDDQSFVDEAYAWGVADRGVGRGLVVSDLNGDGWLDIAKADVSGPGLVHLSNCGDATWLRVNLRDETTANTHAIGARVRVETQRGWMERTLVAGGTGYGSGSYPEAHFGLGSDDTALNVEIEWPDGSTQALGPQPARHVLTVTRTQ